ncbi:glutaredoxin 3-like [Tropilaelaps mercedesae]|uniref:Glutaredoxin 3-like n=1 Tax=Tropilaelaps mercedesae TaxID=418985 RepID=A0A1V9X537_9ACAR|nr:glutaredoxin 3-like [Tropilaelaps mercedesae]
MESITSKDAFDEASAKSTQGFMVVHFFAATWSPECKQMEEVINEVAKDSPKVKFYRVEAEDLEEVSLQFGVTSVPTFVFLLGKSQQEKIVGADPPRFLQKIQELEKKIDTACLGDKDTKTATTPVAGSSSLEDRLKGLITQAPIMLFMKGSPQEARCGFSRKAIEILSKHKVKFDSFDILSDNDVREGLKRFSNWPSYPQLYINGELIGGVDIMSQMDESGELAEALKQATAPDVDTGDLKSRLEKLIHQADVMVFMKGDPQMPRCGFSRTLIGILNETRIPYKTFDILTDEEVRQGLKTYSNWPTYPQVYVKGEFVGGVDIVQQLNESGDLIATLKGES